MNRGFGLVSLVLLAGLVLPAQGQGLTLLGDSLVTATGPLSSIWDRSWNVGSSVHSALQVSGGTAPYTWSLTGPVPLGIGIATSGTNREAAVISGTFSANGIYPMSIRVTDAAGASVSAGPFDVVVGAIVDAAPGTILTATSGRLFTAAFQLTGGTAQAGCTVAIAVGFQCSVQGQTLSVSGTPAGFGTGPFQVRVQTNLGQAYRTFGFTVNPAVSLTAAVPASGVAGSPYSGVLTASQGTAPYSWSVSTGLVPVGTAFQPQGTSAAVSGVLQSSGTFNFTVTVSDRWGSSQSYAATVTVAIPPHVAITSSNPPNGTVGQAYTHTFTASGGFPPVTWLAAGTVPGLTLSPGGLLSGVPAAAGTYAIAIRVVDSGNTSAIQNATIVISPPTPVSIGPKPPLPPATIQMPYSFEFSAAGGTPPYRWGSTTLPPGVSLSNAGVISGTPASTGSFTFFISATDAGNQTASTGYTLVVQGPAALTNLPGGVIGSNYEAATLVQLAGTAPFSAWSVVNGNLPQGLTLDPPTGILSGVPRSTGTYTFTGRSRDANGVLLSQKFQLSVSRASGVIPFSVTDLSAIQLSSAGTSGSPGISYVRIQPDVNRSAPSGVALIQYRSGGTLVSETTIPAAEPVLSGRFFAEVRGAVNTGVAIVNGNGVPVTVTVTFTDTTGTALPPSTIVIPPSGQIAAFIDQAPFSLAAPFTGAASVTATQPVAMTALRGRTNERGDFLLTTIPVVMPGVTVGSVLIPQFAAGGGWTTEVALVNPTSLPLSGTVQFFSPGSATKAPEPLIVNVDGRPSGVVTYVIAPNSAWRVTVALSGTSVETGTVRVIPTAGTPAPAGSLVYGFHASGVVLSETGVAVSGVANAFRLYAENQAQSRILAGIAIANPSPTPVIVNLQLASLSGAIVSSALLTLPGNGQVARYLHEIPGLNVPASFQGVVSITSAFGVAVTGVRGRYNERGDYFETTLAPVNAREAVTTAERILPHIVDGGGYRSEIAIFSGLVTQSSQGFLRFFTPAGAAVDVVTTSTAGPLP